MADITPCPCHLLFKAKRLMLLSSYKRMQVVFHLEKYEAVFHLYRMRSSSISKRSSSIRTFTTKNQVVFNLQIIIYEKSKSPMVQIPMILQSHGLKVQTFHCHRSPLSQSPMVPNHNGPNSHFPTIPWSQGDQRMPQWTLGSHNDTQGSKIAKCGYLSF